ncbi:CaiB/BaiF CoA transferase family protein [Pseudorhodoferax soli]|uniref:Crotonobetainyl-CoA:carnitine CoA-transferase CaiB-like acyl-CoA transferase n=1 Tax=Pseudorhodoferax soli TaxID=545864 RepID=A0A368XNQ0_9BURK|nr:CoA transferase [Pseudorhodoferax soli]RCW68806.1 crotonobetainyl-CoA:carnitine CoA-transferase CaiB-like acyl-CoA transferase [Pseudorhodoferax soli]
MATPSHAPLAGLKVLDLGQIYQGPYCGFLLAMAGATVVKVEPPGGEAGRARRAATLPLAMLNGNKRGIALNFKHAEGRRLFVELVQQFDVVLENYAPGVMDRLGIGAEVLRAANPRLVYASASGYGTWGPDRDRLAMDLTIQATSGAMEVTGWPDRPPVKAGPAFADFLGGTHLYAAIMTALYERERTGVGRRVEIAMQDAMYPPMASNLTVFFENPQAQARTGNRHGGLGLAPYNAYRASDGYVTIMCVTPGHWGKLVHAMGRAELADDPRYADHAARAALMEEVDALVEGWTQRHTRAELQALAQAHHFPCAPVRGLAEVVNDPHLHARGMLRHCHHPELGDVVLHNSPLRFDGFDPLALVREPRLGEHTGEVLAEYLGIDAAELGRLAQLGAVATVPAEPGAA